MNKKGRLVLFSGPSGVGKDTLLDILLEKKPEIRHSVSITTRKKRENEVDGVDYFFISRDRFENMRRVVNEIVSLLEKKNNDYGNSATQTYEEYGDVAFFIRISDKINRLKSLTINNKTQEVKDESIEDTIKDIIGYCLLYLEWKNSEEDK